jgi:hypothetical protein
MLSVSRAQRGKTPPRFASLKPKSQTGRIHSRQVGHYHHTLLNTESESSQSTPVAKCFVFLPLYRTQSHLHTEAGDQSSLKEIQQTRVQPVEPSANDLFAKTAITATTTLTTTTTTIHTVDALHIPNRNAHASCRPPGTNYA